MHLVKIGNMTVTKYVIKVWIWLVNERFGNQYDNISRAQYYPMPKNLHALMQKKYGLGRDDGWYKVMMKIMVVWMWTWNLCKTIIHFVVILLDKQQWLHPPIESIQMMILWILYDVQGEDTIDIHVPQSFLRSY